MTVTLAQADARRLPLADNSVQCAITSPPYFGLRDYGTADWVGGDPACEHDLKRSGGPKQTQGANGAQNGHASKADRLSRTECRLCGARRVDRQIGLEETPQSYVESIVNVFREVWRVLRPDGVVFLNLGDSFANDTKWGGSGSGPDSKNYTSGLGGCVGQKAKRNTGLKPKDLCMIPARVALALQADGWYLRQKITWCKISPMPESVTDRPTSATEEIFLLSKGERYFYDIDACRVASASATIERDKNTRITNGKDGAYAMQHDHETLSDPGGRNQWNYWEIEEEEFPPAISWKLGPESFKGAHFAVFPREIPRRAILLGTSEAGCCQACGAPWKRVTEKASVQPIDYEGKNGTQDPQHSARRMLANVRARRLAGNPHDNPFPAAQTIGWQPTCRCDAGEPVPCTVLDMFSGAGTTSVVASALGRNAVGFDLNLDYLQMSRRRIECPHAPVQRAASANESHPLFDRSES